MALAAANFVLLGASPASTLLGRRCTFSTLTATHASSFHLSCSSHAPRTDNSPPQSSHGVRRRRLIAQLPVAFLPWFAAECAATGTPTSVSPLNRGHLTCPMSPQRRIAAPAQPRVDPHSTRLRSHPRRHPSCLPSPPLSPSFSPSCTPETPHLRIPTVSFRLPASSSVSWRAVPLAVHACQSQA